MKVCYNALHIFLHFSSKMYHENLKWIYLMQLLQKFKSFFIIVTVKCWKLIVFCFLTEKAMFLWKKIGDITVRALSLFKMFTFQTTIELNFDTSVKQSRPFIRDDFFIKIYFRFEILWDFEFNENKQNFTQV